jgi:hypothetical protein
VASTVSNDAIEWFSSIPEHLGSNVVTKPDVGKPSTAKQTVPRLREEPTNVTFIFVLCPTLMTTDEGSTVSVDRACQASSG